MVQGDRRGGQEYLKRDENLKPGGIIGVSDPWGVESTQESKDSTKESRNHHQGVLDPLHGLFLRLGKNGDEGVQVTPE
jgi:hypothetical protein